MTPDELSELIVATLEELKASNIQVLDVSTLTSITDFMIIASGRSSRQVKALADKVVEKVKTAGIPLLGIEGEQQAEWILVDVGDVIIHVMQPSIRAYYQLEKLWDIQEQSKGSSSIN
jgi:ribosome-associated protein